LAFKGLIRLLIRDI